MTNGTAGATAHQAAIANAIKASGAIVRVEPTEFQLIVSKAEKPLVVVAETTFLSTTYQYLTSYKGLIFYTKSKKPLHLEKAELIKSSKIWIPM